MNRNPLLLAICAIIAACLLDVACPAYTDWWAGKAQGPYARFVRQSFSLLDHSGSDRSFVDVVKDTKTERCFAIWVRPAASAERGTSSVSLGEVPC